MKKKNLDKLFQDTFSEHHEIPDERVWDAIAASLDKKKKKRILPLWWSLGGIAAALLIGFVVFNPLNTEKGTEQIITNIQEEQSSTNENTDKATQELQIDNPNENAIQITDNDDKASVFDRSENSVVTSVQNQNSSKEYVSKNKSQKSNSSTAEQDWNTKNEAVTLSQDNNKTYNDSKKGQATSDAQMAQTEMAVLKNESGLSPSQNSGLLQEELTQNSVSEVAVATKDGVKEKNSNTAAESKIIEKIVSESERTKVAVNEDEVNKTKTESFNKKSIYEDIADVEENAVAERSSKKWSAGPSVAPVYFNAIGQGSSVHSIFVPNSKSGNINMSYGVSVGYEISSKLKIRSGFHKVDYGYDTNDIAFSSSPTASTNGQIDNISYRATAKNLVVSSKPGGSALPDAPINSIDVSAQNPEREGFMTQQLDYLEIPLELNYALIDNKFGLNLIGGVSSLFLLDNSVALTSGNLTTEMGDATNVNSLNFSANFGLGVNYNFSRNIQLNIEPMFKYQLNTFSQTDGTFNPYAVGVYSGLSFKF